jgi:hypothetical protein
MGVVWIASYPKSGNTWMRFLLANYLAGPIERSDQVEALIPDYMKKPDLQGLLTQRPVVYSKTHYLWSGAHPFALHTDRRIVVIRHPKDVLLSNLNYRRLNRGSSQGFTDAAYARTFITYGGDPEFIRGGFGTLEQNVTSWTQPSFGPAQLVIRYEDLKADAARELSRIVSYLSLPLDLERLEMAVSHSHFDRMRAMEVREKTKGGRSAVFAGTPPRPGWARYFINEGKVRGSLAHLGRECDRAFNNRFGPLMKRLGYS